MRILHVKGKELEDITDNEKLEFLNGDVYIIDKSDSSIQKKVYIWLGSNSCVDEKAVGPWAAKQLDIKDPEIDIDTIIEGQEPSELLEELNFSVITGDTPGFLRHVEVNAEDISYAMYRIRDMDISDGSSWDDLVIENVPMSKDSLNSNDVFVIDGFSELYVWIGSQSQVGEKAAGNRLVRKLDVDRSRNPLIYVIHEGQEPAGFFDFSPGYFPAGQVVGSAAID